MSWEVVSNYILPPLVGAVIGYFTNLIAVKMLFFPHEEKHIFGHRVPFTPGAIPKGKSRLARSAGKIVQDELFTREDISSKLLTEEVEKPLIDKVMQILNEDIRNTGAVLAGGADKYDKLEKSFVDLLSVKITDAVRRMNIPGAVRQEGIRMIGEHVQNSRILRAVVPENLVDRIMQSVAEKMEDFIDARAPEMVREITSSRIHDLGDRTPIHVLDQAGYDREFVRAKITAAYRESVVNAVNSALRRIDVASVVESKINSMSAEDLEKGVMAVMKNELSMIVNLGALIGLVIGSINIFI
ncbi:MAG: DUF445 family protein [Clostridiales bacterium]|nr:DUF445 family protein [Clostridiales bacterium]